MKSQTLANLTLATAFAIASLTPLQAAISDNGTATGSANPINDGQTYTNVTISATNTAVQVNSGGRAENFIVGASDGSTPDSTKNPTLTINLSTAAQNSGEVTATGFAEGTRIYKNGFVEVKNSVNGNVTPTVAQMNNTTIYDGGRLELNRAALVTNTTIEYGGYMLLKAVAATSGTATVKTGGVLQVGYGNAGPGGLATDTTVDGGLLIVLHYGSSASNNGRGSVDNVTITNNGHMWLGSGKAGNANSYARNITIDSGNLVVWNNVRTADDDQLANVTVNAGGIVRILGTTEASATLYGVTPNANNIINGLTLNGGNVMLYDATPYTGPSKITFTNPSIDFADAASFAPAAAKNLTIKSGLSGAGTFHMRVDLAAGTGDAITLLGNLENFTGQHTISAISTTAPTGTPSYRFVDASSLGDIETDTLDFTGSVTVDDVTPLVYQINYIGNGFFGLGDAPIRPIDDSALNAHALSSSLWFAELQTLRTRLGELRLDNGSKGLWVRGSISRLEVDAPGSGSGATMDTHGFQAGLDDMFAIGGAKLYIGLFGGLSGVDAKYSNYGYGTASNWHAGLYATALLPAGWHVDFVAKHQEIDQRINTSTVLGPSISTYLQRANSLSLETGRRFNVKGWLLEPQLQFVYTKADDSDAVTKSDATTSATNYFEIAINGGNSLLGRAGLTFGRAFTLKNGMLLQPFVTASYAHEFDGKANIVLNRVGSSKTRVIESDLSGARAEISIGADLRLNSWCRIYADLNGSYGGAVERPWGANLGARFSF